MPYRDKQKQRERVKALNRGYRDERIAIVNAVKAAGCVFCGEREPVCLDLHHLDPEEKEFSVSRLVAAHAALERLLAEVAKCVVVCSNCHRKLHAGLLSL